MPQLVIEVVSKPKEWFRTKAQLRKDCCPDGLQRLMLSIEQEGQLQNVGALQDGLLCWGWRRLQAALMSKVITHLQTSILSQELSEQQFLLLQGTENFQREGISAYNTWLYCAEMMCRNPSWQMKDLAAALKLDPASITRYLSPSKTTPAWQEALKLEKVGISDSYAASKLPFAEQDALLVAKLNGASRDQLDCHVRKAKRANSNNDGDEPKVQSIRLITSLGATVTVKGKKGEPLSLESTLKALVESEKAVRRGQSQGLNAATIQRICKDQIANAGKQPAGNEPDLGRNGP